MESRVIAATFDNENAAFEAAQDAQDLERSGVIKIKRGAILIKNENGTLIAPDAKDVDDSWGLYRGGVTGSLLGFLSEPDGPSGSFGAEAGLTVEDVEAALSDAVGHDHDDQFLHDAISGIEPGQTLLLAVLDEDSTAQVDAAVTRRGGTVFRTNLEVISKVERARHRIKRDLDALRAKVEHDIEADQAQIAWENDTLKENDIKVGRLMTSNQQSEYDVYANSWGPASTRPVDE